MNQHKDEATQRSRDLRAALEAILDAVDYKSGACSVTEMVGAVLPPVLIDRARELLRR